MDNVNNIKKKLNDQKEHDHMMLRQIEAEMSQLQARRDRLQENINNNTSLQHKILKQVANIEDFCKQTAGAMKGKSYYVYRTARRLS